jgi:hypothetical protein
MAQSTLMIARWLAVISLTLPFDASAAERECGLALGPAVPDATTARAIASAVIAARQKPQVSMRYNLKIERDGSKGWIAYQAKPPERQPDGDTVLTAGGGGIEMHVNRCSGEISKLYYQK